MLKFELTPRWDFHWKVLVLGETKLTKKNRRSARCRCSSLLLSAWFRPVATFLLCVFTFRARGET